MFSNFDELENQIMYKRNFRIIDIVTSKEDI